MSTESVSIIIPVYNGAELIADAIESILRQTFSNNEIIVVDDGSTDSLPSILRHFPEIRCITQNRVGPAGAKNRGIRESSGTYLAFLDVDDIWLPEKLNHQLTIAEAQPDPGVVGCQIQNVCLPGTLPPSWYDDFDSTYAGFVPSAILVHHGVFETVGMFDESLQVCEDTDWLIRVQNSGTALAAVSEVLLERRFHANNIANQRDLVRDSMGLVLRKNL